MSKRLKARRSTRIGWLALAFVASAEASLQADTFVSGTISTNTTWTLAGSPYVMTGHVYVQGAGTPVLTIQPGVTVKADWGVALLVGYSGAGNLQAVGTAAQPIVFTFNGTPSPGSWEGLRLHSGTVAASKISYATVSYGGGGFAGIHIDTCSPTIQNTTIQNNAIAGLRIVGVSSTSVSSSTITANPVGIWISSPATPSLQTLTISNNTGFAISMDAKVTLGTVSGITATGNGTNGVQLLGNVDVTTTWKKFGLAYFPAASVYVNGSGTPILTIKAGVTVKFPTGSLIVGLGSPGNLQAVGTPAQPIILTTSYANPAPGYWEGVRFYSLATSTSKLTYATVSYAGLSGLGGIDINGASPTIDHVTISNNATAGIKTAGGSPTITNCNFVGNATGMINSTPTSVITARLNYWSSLDGPFGPGGQAVSAGIKYEPWLGTSASSPQFFSAFTLGNSTFNPALSIYANFSFTTAQSGNWTAKVYNSLSVLIRTISGTGTSGAPTWDGKDDAGNPQPNGTYTYQVDSLAGGNGAAPVRGRATIDTTLQLTLANVAVAPPFFSPNGDAVQDTTTLTATASFDGAAWTVTVKNAGGNPVRTATGSATPNISYTWDGKNGSGAIQLDGVYTLQLVVTDGTASASASGTATLDRLAPVGTITDPPASSVVSNVYRGGATTIPVTGSATDLNLQLWTLEYGAGTNPLSFNLIATGTTPVSSGTFAQWATEPLANGPYQLRLTVLDLAGNKTVPLRNITIGNFRVASSAYEVKRAIGGTVNLVSTIPFTLYETLVIKNALGATVRTLVNDVNRVAGTYTDVWDGRDGSGAFPPDGPYFFVATVRTPDDVYSITYDLSNQYAADYFSTLYPTLPGSYDPFYNQPLALDFTVPTPGRLTVIFALEASPTGDCLPPHVCLLEKEYVTTGPKSLLWAGTDSAGLYHPELVGLAIGLSRNQFPKNAIVVDGTAPSIANMRLTPPLFSPVLGPQVIEFDLTTYQSQAATVSIAYFHQDSAVVVRTLTFSSQLPGHRTYNFDGKDSGGGWLPPGNYTVTLTVTDSIGNSKSSRLLGSLEY